MPEITSSRYTVTCGWDDVPHLDERTKRELLDTTPEHLKDARSLGTPALGAGAIYPIKWKDVTVPPMPIPAYWPRGYALDVGWKRTAALWGAFDRESDTLYITTEYYRGQAEPTIHAAAIKARGEWIPGVIDPAARGRSQLDGRKLLTEYLSAGLNLDIAKNAVEAGIYMVWERLSTGRIKIFSTCANLADEYRFYRRDENGKIVKENDHLLDCLRYIVLRNYDFFKVRPFREFESGEANVGDSRAGY